MASTLRKIQIYIATLDDMVSARDGIMAMIRELGDQWSRLEVAQLIPVDWRTAGNGFVSDASTPPEILTDIDVFVGVLWKQLYFPYEQGSDEPSRFEREFNYVIHDRQASQTEVFWAQNTNPLEYGVNSTPAEFDNYRQVQRFVDRFSRAYRSPPLQFKTDDQLIEAVRRALLLILQNLQKGIRGSTDRRTLSSLDRWNNDWGLKFNPFANASAVNDILLPSYFDIQVIPYFDVIAGLSGQAFAPTVIFGASGTGKSAIRSMISHYSLQGNKRIFVIALTDFLPLIAILNSGKPITAASYVPQILQLGVAALAKAIDKGEARLKPATTPAERREIWKYVLQYRDRLSEQDFELLKLTLEGDSTLTVPLPASPIDQFKAFCRAIRIVGYDVVFVLVDGLDESDEVTGDEMMARLISPLLRATNLHTLDENLAAFRFFVPEQLKTRLISDDVRLKNLIMTYSITDYWDAVKLQNLIKLRLQAAKVNAEFDLQKLAELSNVPNLDQILIELAYNNPRNLINLINRLIIIHCEDYPNEDGDQDPSLNETDLRKLEQWWTINAPPSPLTPLPPASDDLPTPIAVLVARYEHSTSSSEKIRTAFTLTQTILQFCVCTLLALAPTARLDELGEVLFSPSKPPTLGKWHRAANMIEIGDDYLSAPIRNFQRHRTLQSNLDELIELRNAYSHHQAADDEEYVAQAVHAQMQNLLEALRHLTVYNLASVVDHVIATNRELVHVVRLHRGNIVQPPLVQIKLSDNIPLYQVVVYRSPEFLVSLYPFVCCEIPTEPALSNREVFIFDRLTQAGKNFVAHYVNVESGHKYRSSDETLISEFRQRGFISDSSLD